MSEHEPSADTLNSLAYRPRRTDRGTTPDQAETTPSSLPLQRRQGAESHASLTASIHEVFGNHVLQSALAGLETDGPGQLLQGAMSLGAAGVVLSDSVDGVFSNSAVQALLASGASGADAGGDGGGAAPMALAAKRRAAGDPEDGQWGRDAVRSVGTAMGRSGRSLPTELAQKIGAAMGGVDFSGVRIHTDGAASRAAQAIHARAFTVGTDVYFDEGEYSPGSRDGQELLAHELTHVRQHMEGRLPSGGSGDGDLDVSSPFDAHEVEAERTAAAVVSELPRLESSTFEATALDAGVGADLTGVGADAGGVAASAAGTDGLLSRDSDRERLRTREADDARARDRAGGGEQKTEAGGAPTNKFEAVNTKDKSSGQLNDAVVQSFRDAAAVVQQLTGVNIATQMSDTTRAMSSTTQKVGADNVSWHKTGRALDLNQDISWLIMKDPSGDDMYFRLYLPYKEQKKTGAEEGTGGTAGAGGTAARPRADAGAQGGGQGQGDSSAFIREFPKGTEFYINPYGSKAHSMKFVDVTAILTKYGWGRIRAHSGWGKTGNAYNKQEWWHYEQRGGNTWYEASRQIYSEEDMVKHLKQLTGGNTKHRARLEKEGVPENVLDQVFAKPQPQGTGKKKKSRHAAGALSRDAEAGTRPAGEGRTLPSAVQDRLGPLLGGPGALGQVRLHTDADAARYAEAHRADALTEDGHIFFSRGRFDVSSPEGMALLAEELHHAVFGGGQPGVSQPGDAHERSAAQFAAGAADLLSERVAPEDAIQRLAGGVPMPGILQRLMTVYGHTEDAEDAYTTDDRVARTDQLLDRLTQGLGLGRDAVQVRTDDAAGDAVRGLHTRGLMAGGGEILLDAARYNPDTTSGRSLLAHEVTHVAQESLPAAVGVSDAGALAEFEAHSIADSFAGGGAIEGVSVGLPEGHVAAEGDITGSALAQLMAEYSALNTERTGGVVVPESPELAEADDGGTQNRRKKVRQYRDGVDGVADLIGDLDAFEALRDAIDDGEDTSAPMSRIRGSENFGMLCQMWQGALDGEEDSAELQRCFNSEFDGRGFWGNTEQAFDMVCSAAKAAPRRNAAGNAAAEQRTEGQGEQPVLDGPGEGEGEDVGAPAGGPAITPEQLAASQATLDVPIPELPAQAEAIPAFEALRQVQDTQIDAITFENNHQHGLATSVPVLGPQGSRVGQVWDQLTQGFTGSFTQAFTDQFLDTLVLDTAGMLGDKALTALSRGTFRVPFIGPMIGLIQNKPWSAEFWTGMGNDLSSGWGSLGSMVDNFGRLGQVDSFMDGVGVFCAALADLFGGLRDIVKVAQQLVGTLSAVCYVAGGILIALGLCLVWLAGVGAPLITAGGWFVRAGGILARINTALGAVLLVLSGLATVFRTAAALLVPAELYADQLVAVGNDANAFGTAAGNKAGDVTATRVRDGVASMASGRSGDGPPAANDGEVRAQSDVERARQQGDEGTRRLEEDQRRLQAETEQQRQRQGDEDPDAARRTEDGPGVGSRIRRIVTAPARFAKNAVVELVASVRDLGSLRHGRQAAEDGLQPMRGDMIEAIRARARNAEGRIAELNLRLEEARVALDGADPRTAADLVSEMRTLNGELATARRDLERAERLEAAVDRSRSPDPEQAARQDRARQAQEDDPEQLRQDAEAQARRLQELDAQEGRLREQVQDLERRLPEAEAQQRARQEALDRHQRDLDQENAHIDGIERASRRAAEARDLTERQRALRDEARLLRDQAETATTARRDQGRLTEMETQLQTARDQSDQHRQVLDSYNDPGRRNRVTIQVDGGTSQRDVKGFSADGLVVSDGRGRTITVPFDQITSPQRLRDAGNGYREQQRTVERLTGETERLRTDLDRRAVGDADPEQLRTQAAARDTEAEGLNPQIEDARANSNYSALGATDMATHLRFRDMHTRNRDAAQAQVTSSTTDVDRLRGELNTARTELGGIPDQRTAAERARTDALERARRAEGMKHTTDYVVNSSSGNATGGVGSAYKDLHGALIENQVLPEGIFLMTFRYLDQAITKTDHIASMTQASGQAAPKTLGGAAQQAVDGWLGTARQDQDTVRAIAGRQAALEQLSALAPPVVLGELLENRERARQAAQRYYEKHDWAYQCTTAQGAVKDLAQQTLNMAQAGEPLRETSRGMDAPLQEGRSNEQARQGILSGANTNVPQPDSALSGLVTELILKLATHSDDFDQQPSGGDSGSGATVADAQTQASDEAGERGTQSTGASEEQRAFLDEAISLRAQQEGAISTSIDTLNAKHLAEMEIYGEIDRLRAQALSERDAARSETESYSQAFTGQLEQMQTWSESYRAQREALPQ